MLKVKKDHKIYNLYKLIASENLIQVLLQFWLFNGRVSRVLFWITGSGSIFRKITLKESTIYDTFWT
jgi:hypothetical protein